MPDLPAPVALGLQPPPAINPIAGLLPLMQVQAAANQNRLFQQQWQAKQKIGQIMAGAPDLESGLKSVLADPLAAPFAGDLVNTLRQAMLAETQQKGELQKQGFAAQKQPLEVANLAATGENTRAETKGKLQTQQFEAANQPQVAANLGLTGQKLASEITGQGQAQAIARAKLPGELGIQAQTGQNLALEGATKSQELESKQQAGLLPALTAAITDPNRLEGALEIGLAAKTPEERKNLQPLVDSIKKSVLEGVDLKDPGTWGTYKAQLAGLLQTVQPASQTLGKIDLTDVKSGLQPTMVPSPISGIAPGPVGPLMPFGLPPDRQTTTSGAVVNRPPVQTRMGPLGPEMDSNIGSGQVPGQTAAGAPAGNLAIQPSGAKYEFGGALPPAELGQSPNLGYDKQTGAPYFSPMQEKKNEELLKDYSTKGKEQYEMAGQALGQLERMSASFDRINKGQTWQSSGSFGEARQGLAKLGVTIKNMLGPGATFGEGWIDPEKVASSEDLMKDTRILGLMLTKQYLGQAREAATTIQGITSSVPNIENTDLGRKLVISGMQAIAQRAVDERKFTNAWGAKNAGAIDGAAEEFNRQYPPQTYARQVLADHGLNPAGKFSSEDDIVKAYGKGLIDKATASKLLKDQFGRELQ